VRIVESGHSPVEGSALIPVSAHHRQCQKPQDPAVVICNKGGLAELSDCSGRVLHVYLV